ncbi:MAG TPA: class I SAM-dependent methyltransferase [Candidatus Binatia bacterium]|jgi:SAM-dependent methyltransferase
MSDAKVTTSGAFDADVRANAGYRYTTNAPLSSVLANRRLTALTLAMVDLRGRTVIDVGCGDGTYTHDLFVAGAPALMFGVDATKQAAVLAATRYASAGPTLRFAVGDATALPCRSRRFDIAIVRGLLHHLDDAPRALAEIGRIASEVCVIEPNGYNPGLKIIERLSRYHREHGEKSYPARRIRRWIRELGGTIDREEYAGLVPFFCPRSIARALKVAESVVERVPVVRNGACAVFAVRYRPRSPR